MKESDPAEVTAIPWQIGMVCVLLGMNLPLPGTLAVSYVAKAVTWPGHVRRMPRRSFIEYLSFINAQRTSQPVYSH
jgi:hypothetical protein